MNATSLLSTHYAGDVQLPGHFDMNGVPTALNYRLDNATMTPPTSMLKWREAAEDLVTAQQIGVESDHWISSNPPLADASMARGELMSGQLIAVFMNRVYGMPLITWKQARENPSWAEMLRRWSDAGYQAQVTDAVADVEWTTDAGELPAVTPTRILKRTGPPPQASQSSSTDGTKSAVPLEERERRYAAAKERIFGMVSAVDAESKSTEEVADHGGWLPSLYSKVDSSVPHAPSRRSLWRSKKQIRRSWRSERCS